MGGLGVRQVRERKVGTAKLGTDNFVWLTAGKEPIYGRLTLLGTAIEKVRLCLMFGTVFRVTKFGISDANSGTFWIELIDSSIHE